MKTIITSALLFIISICRSSVCQAQMNPCEHFLTPVLALSAGGPYNLYAEGGVMGFSERIGVYAGAKLFLREHPVPAKTSSQFSETIKPYARVTYRISNQDASLIRQYLTGWYGLNGIRGVSYRLGLILSESTMLALEPNYSRENGKGVNITLLARLN